MTSFTNLATPNEQNKKRRAVESVSLSDDEDCVYPRFLIVKAKDDESIRLSIFGIQKLLSCAIPGEIKSAKKLRNGCVLIESINKNQSDKLLAMTAWVDQVVTVTAHRSLNSCRGLIRCREFRDCDESEVRLALSGQGVTAAKRISVKRDGKVEPTNTFILTFGLPSIPSYVTAAYMKIPVESYIPNPLRCYSCQKFGHGQSTCNRQAICAKCAEHGHLDSVCPNNARCANCRGPHTAYSKDCPEWTKQREINKVKYTRNVSFIEAKNIVDKQSMPNMHSATLSGLSYAVVAGGGTSLTKVTGSVTSRTTTTQSVEIQTDFTWPPDSKMPVLVADVATKKTSHQSTETQTKTTSYPASPAPIGISNIPQGPKTTSTAPTNGANAKPGPASSKAHPTTNAASKPTPKPTNSNRPSKGAGDPLKLYNKYHSLDDMTMDLGGGSSPPKKK